MMTSKPTAVIVDVDGTLCDITGVLRYLDGTEYGFDKRGRPIKNFDKFHEAAIFCPPNQQALDYCAQAHADGHALVVVTARMEQHRYATTQWLHNTLDPYPWKGPMMRREGDYRPDTEIKYDIFMQLQQHVDIVGAIDDNPNIIDLWRSLDIPTEVVPRPAGDGTLRPFNPEHEATTPADVGTL